MRKAVMVVLVLATLATLATFAIGGVALAQTPTPSAGAGDRTPWIGVSLVDLSDRVAARLGISQTTGVAVATVVAGSPAEKAGIKAKDVLTTVDGKQVSKASDVSAAVTAKKAGDSLAVAVMRDGQAMNLTVTVGEKSQPSPQGRADKDTGGQAAPKSRFGGLLDGLKGLSPNELFGHMLGGQQRFLDQNNKPITIKTIPGVVVSASKDSVTIKPNDAAESGGPYAITSDTQVWLSGNATVDTLKAGDQVVVITADGKTALSVTSGAHGGFGGWSGERPGGGMSPHGGFGRGRDRGTKSAPATPGKTS